MIGRTLSHYKILEEISRGGMGIVYRALDVKLDREVALKVLPPELVADPERKGRFIQEAKAAAKLEHPNIGVVYEIDDADGVNFIAMELIEGEKLGDIIKKERLPLTRSLELATEVAEGLARAHDKGIVHRDLKPANIMVTEQGHAKIIDFGLAKLVEPLAGEGSDVETAVRAETDPGKVMGTVSYMSPEQARGKTVDHRSDIFSFGIVLHEVLTGQPPFRGESGIETLNAILKVQAPRLPAQDLETTTESAADLQRIVDKCLAKDPGDRYQGMKDLVVDLRTARRRLESGPVSGTVTAAVSPTRRKRWLYAGAFGAAALILVAVFLLFPWPQAEEEAPASPSKPSIAVLLFDNLSEDASLDWLRTGIADMLITDLSQSPHLSILTMDRLQQILQDINKIDERVNSLEMVREVAEKADATTMVLGSFMKAGDSIRINIRIQDVPSGEILSTDKVEGVGESSIFPMVDDLNRRIQTQLKIPIVEGTEWAWDLESVTSLEAYRYYVEARNLHYRGKYREEIPLLEKAIEIDPGYAMALRGLAAAYGSLGEWSRLDEYCRQAMEHTHGLPLRESLFIEGWCFAYREETFERAMQALLSLTEAYPDTAGTQPLWQRGLKLKQLERYEEAVQSFEKARIGSQMGGVYGAQRFDWFADCYRRKGDYEKGHEILLEYLGHYPDNPWAHYYVGLHMLQWGKLDEAANAFEKAESLRPDRGFPFGRWTLSILREQWEESRAPVEDLAASDGVRGARGSWLLGVTSLYGGRSRDALGFFKKAIDAWSRPGRDSGFSHNYTARILLARGEAGQALEAAQKAQRDDPGNPSEWEGLFLEAIAQAKLDLRDEAEKTAETLRVKAESLPTEKEKRRYHHLLGELALARGESTLAIEELKKAQSMLPGHGTSWQIDRLDQHVLIWFSLASAHLAAGDYDSAAEWFQRVTESTTEHIWWPIPYVRSFYFLGKIHENRGEMEKAREYYRRFYEYWKDGDMDRERVEEG